MQIYAKSVDLKQSGLVFKPTPQYPNLGQTKTNWNVLVWFSIGKN